VVPRRSSPDVVRSALSVITSASASDLRYLRSFEDPVEANELDIRVGNLTHWRGTV